jgi:hypothetical protein
LGSKKSAKNPLAQIFKPGHLIFLSIGLLAFC